MFDSNSYLESTDDEVGLHSRFKAYSVLYWRSPQALKTVFGAVRSVHVYNPVILLYIKEEVQVC